MKSNQLFLLTTFLVAALLPGSAFAAKVAVANCSDEFVTVCAYNSDDDFHAYPSSSKGLNPGTAGKVTCGTSSSCDIWIIEGSSNCQFAGIADGLANWIRFRAADTLGNLSYQFSSEGFNEIGNSSHTFDDGGFCSAQNGNYCEEDNDCYSGNCVNNECVIASAATVSPMCSREAGDVTLSAGTVRTSCDGRYSLTMQVDGNLVLYNELGTATWATMTFGTGNRAAFQADGNLVVYDASGVARWASNTYGNPNSKIILQNDGNLVIYREIGGFDFARWATNTVGL